MLLAGALTLTGMERLPQASQLVQAAENLPCTDTEWEVLRLVNQERLKYGANPLSTFGNIQKAAQLRSKELRTLFDHMRPNGEICFSVLKEFNCDDWMAGENIAIDFTTPAAVMNAWMNSPMHRMNILTGGFSHLGIGHYKKSRDYWTQLFTGSCTPTAIEIQGIDKDAVYAVERGTKIEQMNLALSVTCRHGESYLPIDSSYCSGYNRNDTSNKIQNVRISCLGQSTGMKLLVHSKIPAISGIKAEPSGNGRIKLSWKKPSGISNYIVEYSTQSSGPFKQEVLENYNNTSFYIRNLKPGTKYYIRMTPVKTVNGQHIRGDQSKVTYTRTVPADTKITKIDNRTKGRLTLTWTGVKGAAAYRIYYSPTKSGPYKAIGLVKEGTNYTFTHTGLKSGSKGYYKIRPYIRMGNKNYYGAYSDIKYAVVK